MDHRKEKGKNFMSDIRIDRVIIHILDSSVGIPVLSDVEVEHGSDFNDFLRAHILSGLQGEMIRSCFIFMRARRWKPG